MNTKETSQEGSGGLAVAGLIASAVAATIYFYGKHGDERRQRLRSWVLQVKGEILKRIEQLDQLTAKQYKNIVDQVTEKYAQRKHVRKQDIQRLRKRLKGHWQDIRESINDHVAYVKQEADELPDTITTEAVAEAAREVVDTKDISIDHKQDISDLLHAIIDAGVEALTHDQSKQSTSADKEQ